MIDIINIGRQNGEAPLQVKLKVVSDESSYKSCTVDWGDGETSTGPLGEFEHVYRKAGRFRPSYYSVKEETIPGKTCLFN